jgi:hypothetical protein
MQLVSCHISVNSEILFRNISLTTPSPHSFRPVCFKLTLLYCRLARDVASGYARTHTVQALFVAALQPEIYLPPTSTGIEFRFHARFSLEANTKFCL